jgi:hypothetical protein
MGGLKSDGRGGKNNKFNIQNGGQDGFIWL